MSEMKLRSTTTRILAATFGGFVVIVLCIVFAKGVSRSQAAPERSLINLELPSPEWQVATIETSDKISLKAWYFPTKNGATVVMLHGYGANRSELLPEATLLKNMGYGLLLYDTRGHGESAGKIIGYGENETLDLEAALNWLFARPEVDVTRVGGYGFSMGGYIMAREAVTDPRLSAIVLAGTPNTVQQLLEDGTKGDTWGRIEAYAGMIKGQIVGDVDESLSTRAAVKNLGERPILIIAGTEDKIVPLRRSEEIFESATYSKQLVVFEKAEHGKYRESDPARFAKVLGEFYEKTLRKNDPATPKSLQP